MSDVQLHQDIGHMKGRLDALERDMRDVKADLKTLVEAITAARGGWKTLVVVGGLAAAVSAGLVKIAGFLWRG